VDDLLEMVVTNLFVEPTLKVQDWRVVQISQRLIEKQVSEATSIEALQSNPMLMAWFGQLCKSNEAKRAIFYIFRTKCEKIDLHYLTWSNALSIYERYQTAYANGTDESRFSTAETEASINALREKQVSNKEVIDCLIDIVDVISCQIFEKMTTIPYAIVQFCKCLYQHTRNKFGSGVD